MKKNKDWEGDETTKVKHINKLINPALVCVEYRKMSHSFILRLPPWKK